MSVDIKTVEQIAFLARIGIQKHQLQSYQNEINQVLNLVDEMQSLDLSEIRPTFHPIESNQLLTNDQPNKEAVDDLVFQNAPKSDHQLFLVPTVIE